MDTKKSKLLTTLGLIIGLLSFLFILTNSAISYSDNARFCLNCHSMNDAYESLQHSTHKQFKCTECHAPHSYFAKLSFKTRAGLHDLYVTTLGTVPQVIRATDESKEVIAQNCIRCHKTTVENVAMGQGRLCTDCHRDAAHKRL